MTQAEYESTLKVYANSLGLRGVVNDTTIKLLAYSMNLLASELNNKILNNSFSSATNVNVSIAHAASLLYSVYRGLNPKVSMTNIVANMDKSYNYLDDAFQYNGLYYFYNKRIDTIQSQIYNVEYVVSDKPRQSVSQYIGDANYHYIDFNYANISESIRILKDGNTLATWTSDPYEFISDGVKSDGTYDIDYLVTTIPDYGIRISKRFNQDWDCTSLTLDYLNYYEVAPDVTNLRSIGDFSFDLDTSDSASISYKARLESVEAIYMDATKTFMSRNQIGSITDVESIIEAMYDEDTGEYVRVYNIVHRTNYYDVYVKAGNMTVNQISAEINRRNPPYVFNVSGMVARPIVITCRLTNPSKTIEELNGYFNPLWQTYRSLTLNKMMTQILRYDESLTSCILTVKSGSIQSELNEFEYYDIVLEN